MNYSKLRNYPYIFIFLYGLVFMTNAIISVFLPVYLENIGFTRSLTGVLLGAGPFVALLSQPFWGMAGDRAATKNRVLKILILGTLGTVLLFPLGNSFLYILFIITLFSFFRNSVPSLSDTITLEFLEDRPWSFSPIRMAGTIGYALMAVVAGKIADIDINMIFILYFLLGFLVLLCTWKLPVIRGHQSHKKKVPYWHLLKYKELMVLIIFSFIILTTINFYISFFPIYFTKEIGGSGYLLGWAISLAALVEIPFLLLADKIMPRIGPRRAMFGAAVIGGIRWLLVFYVNSPTGLLFTQVLHGLHFIVLYIAMVTYINKNVAPELKASGQSFYGLVYIGLTRIVGNTLGGFLSDIFGLRNIFLYNGILSLISAGLFLAFLLKRRRKRKLK